MKKIIFTVFLFLLVYSESWATTKILNTNKTSVNFGSFTYGSAFSSTNIILTNTGDVSITVSSAYFALGSSGFTVSLPGATISTTGPFTVSILASIWQNVGVITDTLVIVNNSDNLPILKIPVTITVTPSTVPYSWDKSSIDFGHAFEGTGYKYDTVSFSTTSFAGMDILEARFTSQESYFNVFINNAPPVCTLMNFTPVKFGISFSPDYEGTYYDTLRVKTSSTPTYVYIPVKAIVDPAGADINVDKTELDYGTNGYGEAYKDQTITITSGNSDQPTKTLTVSGFSLDYPDSLFYVLENFPFTLAYGQTKTLTIRFFPNRTGDIINVIRLLNNSVNNPNAGITLGAHVSGSNISVNTGSIDFGNVGLQSAARDTFFTITNTGPYKLQISSLSEFVSDSLFRLTSIISPASPVLLTQNQTYKVFVRLNPYQLGLKKDSINVANNSSANPAKRVTLSANIVNPTLTITPAELDFGTTKLDTPAKVMSVSIKNSGASALTISKKEILNDTTSFKFLSGSSGVTLSGGQTDSFRIEFRPRLIGAKNAVLQISSNDPLGPVRQINLKGTGGGKAVLFADKQLINFGDIVAGSSKDTTIIIRNDGNINLNITSKSFIGTDNGMFSFVSGGSAVPLAAGATETVKIRITGAFPVGSKTAQFSIASNDPDKPTYTVSLTAMVKAPVIASSPDRITFDTTVVGSYRDTTVTISNTGNSDLIITNILFDGAFATDFSIDKLTYPFIIQQNGLVKVNIRFRPSSAGLGFSRMVIQSNDPANPEMAIILIGNSKVVDQASLNVPFKILNFGKVLINTNKDTLFTISNSGTLKLIIDSLSLSGTDNAYFSLSGFTLPIQLDPGNSQNVALRFLPTLPDTNKVYSVDIRIKSSDPSNPLVIINTVGSGKNQSGSYTINLNTNQINFGTVTINGYKDTTITIISSAITNKIIDSLNIIGSDKAYFSVQNVFPITLLPNTPTNITVRFNPTLVDLQKIYSATLRIKTNDVLFPLFLVDLTGKGYQDQSQISLFINFSKIDFGKVTLGYSSDTSITLKNSGTISFPINSISMLGKDSLSFTFLESITLPFTLAPLENRTFKIRFLAGSLGSKVAYVKITTGGTSPVTSSVDLSGQGVVPQIQAAASLDFGNIKINNSKDTFIVVKNNGEGILSVSNIKISGIDSSMFAFYQTTPFTTINPIVTDTVYCKFIPKSRGSKSASLIIASNDPANPNLNISLTGLGVAPQISIVPQTINFGKVKVGSLKDTTFKIENTGNASLNVSDETISGTNSDKFSIVSGFTPFSLAGSEVKTFTLRFQSADVGIKTARINLTSDDVDNPVKYIDLNAEAEALVTAKIINQTTDTTASSGQSKTINFSLSNTVTPDWIRIFYRIGGTTNYDSAAVTGSGTSFSYVFSPNLITSRGLEYYIKMNINGSEVTLPETNYRENPLSIKVKITTVEIPTPMLARTYSLLSIPFDFSGKNFYDELVRNFGNPDPYTWRILVWSGTDYSELTETNHINLTAGQGFWAISSVDFNLNFMDVYNTPTNSNYKITLNPGWNIIGDPFLYPVSIDNIVYPLGKNVDQVLWKWNGSNYEAETANLNPFVGYFIMNNETTPVDLFMKPVFTTLTNIVTSKNNQILSTNEWKIKLIVKEENKIKDAAEFGAVSATSKRFNFSKPPVAPGSSTDIRLMNNEKGYANYFYETNEKNMVWDVEIGNLNKNKKNQITLEKTGVLPNGYELIVIDNATGCKVNLSSNCINIPQGTTKKSYKIVAGANSFVEQELTTAEITHYNLMQNYPNPFNPSTNIEYTVPDNSFVSLKVYNQLGQVISTLVNENQSKGKYLIKWNAGSNPSGIYYYKISAGNYSSMKKMLLIK